MRAQVVWARAGRELRLSRGATWLLRVDCVIACCVVAVSGCGGKVLLEGDTEDANEPLPPLPFSCEAAIAAIDWTDCLQVAGPDLRTTMAIVCAHEVATKGCSKVATAYWSCLAEQAPACVVTSTEPPGSVGTAVDAPACDAILDDMSTCLTDCRTAYRCEKESWSDCRCDAAAAHAGAECVAYPTVSSWVPDCNVLCSSCEET